jgi:hypothetical protein
MHSYDITYYFVNFCVVVMLIAALVGFIFVQIKARPIWRLLSIALVLIVGWWVCYNYTMCRALDGYAEYIRGNAGFVQAVERLAAQGHTNEVRQVCQEYLNCYWAPNNLTDFDKVVEHTEILAYEQPKGALDFYTVLQK